MSKKITEREAIGLLKEIYEVSKTAEECRIKAGISEVHIPRGKGKWSIFSGKKRTIRWEGEHTALWFDLDDRRFSAVFCEEDDTIFIKWEE